MLTSFYRPFLLTLDSSAVIQLSCFQAYGRSTVYQRVCNYSINTEAKPPIVVGHGDSNAPCVWLKGLGNTFLHTNDFKIQVNMLAVLLGGLTY